MWLFAAVLTLTEKLLLTITCRNIFVRMRIILIILLLFHERTSECLIIFAFILHSFSRCTIQTLWEQLILIYAVYNDQAGEPSVEGECGCSEMMKNWEKLQRKITYSIPSYNFLSWLFQVCALKSFEARYVSGGCLWWCKPSFPGQKLIPVSYALWWVARQYFSFIVTCTSTWNELWCNCQLAIMLLLVADSLFEAYSLKVYVW